MAEIQGGDVITTLREAGTTGSFAQLVCETANSMSGTTNVNVTATKCGPKVAVSDPEVSWSFDAVAETAPTSGQVSYEQMLAWFAGKTKLEIERKYPSDGSTFYQKAECYITELSDASNEGELFTFSGTLTMNGILDIIP